MELSCNVVRDILPLYVEDMTCEETRRMIEAHLCGCAGCKSGLAELTSRREVQRDQTITCMKRVSTGIKRTKLWTVATAVLLVITVIANLLVFLTFPVWATADEAIKKVECLDDGRIKVYFTEQYAGMIGADKHGNHGILCQRERWKSPFHTRLPEGMNEASYGNYMILGNTTVNGEVFRYAKDDNIWYVNYRTGIAETLLWDSGDASHGIRLMEMSYLLLWIFVGAGTAFAITALLGILLRNRAFGGFFQKWAAILGSFCISTLVVTSGMFMVYEEFWMKMSIIAILTVLMSATVLCGLRLQRLKRKIGV